jgi:hypothetical protein
MLKAFHQARKKLRLFSLGKQAETTVRGSNFRADGKLYIPTTSFRLLLGWKATEQLL